MVFAPGGVDRGATASVLEDVRVALASHSAAIANSSGSNLGSRPVHVSELTASDCTTLTAAMKALIGGFISLTEDGVYENGSGVHNVSFTLKRKH